MHAPNGRLRHPAHPASLRHRAAAEPAAETGPGAGRAARDDSARSRRVAAVQAMADGRLRAGQVAQREPIWDEVNKPFGSQTKESASGFADRLSESSDEFAKLRGTADEQVQEGHGKNLKYAPKPKKGGGRSEAYFKDDTAFFNMSGHPAMILSNIIFETANAAQGGRFREVEGDYKSGRIMDKTSSDYGFGDLGALAGEYEGGDAAKRCSIIQERLEWNSFQLARPSFLQVKGEMQKDETGREMYATYFAAFDDMLSMKSFEEYYTTYGHIHRNAVEGVLRKVAEQEKNKRKCYLTTACCEARGLADDCEELTALRRFRDEHLLPTTEGAALVAAYYREAPAIVAAIHRREDELEILARIYGVVRQCVAALRRGRPARALRLYRQMVESLRALAPATDRAG